MALVSAIETAGPDGRARRILFDDGSERLTSNSVVRALELDAGSTGEHLEDRLSALEPELARERALRLLGYRERSTSELAQRLGDDGYPLDVVSEIVQAYVRVGLLDDARFAEAYARTKKAAGYGASRIVHELRKKGIPPQLAADVTSRNEDDDTEVARARAVLRGATPTDRKHRERLLRKLVGRGFSIGVALRAIAPIDPI
ncbi:MAG: regulatory protein RecX, partial [Coriobacteriales bacterium]|nr:regulatory protein RecX [Coriobacteriales bacterium]